MDDRTFRNAMGSFATGVTIITTELEKETYGMTANAFMSVSMNPKLAVISIDNDAQMLQTVKESRQYAVNILSEDQQDLSMHFAGQKETSREIPFTTLQGIPVIDDAVAQISCDVIAEHVEGDHTLFIGKINGIQLKEHKPLIFYKGNYHSLERQKELVNN